MRQGQLDLQLALNYQFCLPFWKHCFCFFLWRRCQKASFLLFAWLFYQFYGIACQIGFLNVTMCVLYYCDRGQKDQATLTYRIFSFSYCIALDFQQSRQDYDRDAYSSISYLPTQTFNDYQKSHQTILCDNKKYQGLVSLDQLNYQRDCNCQQADEVESFIIISTMSETNNYLYRDQIYQAELHREHVSFLRQGFVSYLTIPNPKNHLYYPAQLSLRAEQRIISQLNNKSEKTQFQFLFLIVALKLAGQSYHVELSDYKKIFPNVNHSQQIDKYVDYFSKIPAHVVTNKNKQSIRWQYEKLLGKANSEGYFTIQDVPVFLISTQWLEQLYSKGQNTPSPISNLTLLQPVQFPLAEERYMHYNYQVREDLRENNDYKLVPYEAWQHLYKIYGGFEVRRFTTKEREPIVQVWLIKVSILIVQDRCVFHNLQLQASKNDSIAQLLERVRLTLKKYKIVPQKYLQRNVGLYKSRQMNVKEVVSILQDDTHPCIVSHRFQNIVDFSLQVDEAGILTPHDILILNLSQQKGIFAKIPTLKILSVRERCLNCGSNDGLQACKCRTVFFCSLKCKDSQKAHQKDCNQLVAETKKYNTIVDYYEVKRRYYPELKKISETGKVGFQNLGNTCYMNAALQCLIRLPNLSEFFLSNGHLKDLNVGNVLGSGGHIACAYGQLVKSFYTTNKRSLQPAQILRCIAKNPQFRGHNHQDSQQFLNYFLDKLHEDLNKIKVKPYTEEVESNGRSDEIVSRLSWDNYKKRNDSFVSDLLAGQYRSQIRCPDCNRLSITFDPFLSVTLQFPKPQKGQLLQGYYMTEQGQFLKVSVQLKLNMNTAEFYQKYFGHPVQGVYIKDKKITEIWDKTKTIFQNKRSTGLLFFFDEPEELPIQITIEFYTENKNTLQYFSRIVKTKELNSSQDLAKLILLSIRRPFQKVLQKDLSESQYLELCMQKQVLKIRSVQQKQKALEFPIFGSRKLVVKLELLYKKVTNVIPKLNTTCGNFQGLVSSLVKKLKGQLSVQELLQCFSSPQKLTEQNAWYCSVCKGHKLAQKAMSLYTLPEYLIVHLKRFNHRGDSGNRYIIYGQKVTTPIALQEFQEISGRKYELLGVVNHFGSLVHGHYTACVKRDEWHNYDDSRCYRSSLDGKNAYLLFYKHVQ